jgi:hypothetical protein
LAVTSILHLRSLAVVESQIKEALRQLPLTPVKLVEATDKKPAAPLVKRCPKLTAKCRRRLS